MSLKNYFIAINPVGEIFPVPIWAYPHGTDLDRGEASNRFSLGRLNDEIRFGDVLSAPRVLPRIDYQDTTLFPFELCILSEHRRQQLDLEAGFGPAINPYDITKKEELYSFELPQSILSLHVFLEKGVYMKPLKVDVHKKVEENISSTHL